HVSGWHCEITPARELRLGFCVVSGLGSARGKAMLEERARKPFASFADFLARAKLTPTVLETLALGEAFACFGLQQREALWRILAYQMIDATESSGQLGLFTGVEQASASAEAPRFAALTEYDKIRLDFEAYGLSVRGHPMEALRRVEKR